MGREKGELEGEERARKMFMKIGRNYGGEEKAGREREGEKEGRGQEEWVRMRGEKEEEREKQERD